MTLRRQSLAKPVIRLLTRRLRPSALGLALDLRDALLAFFEFMLAAGQIIGSGLDLSFQLAQLGVTSLDLTELLGYLLFQVVQFFVFGAARLIPLLQLFAVAVQFRGALIQRLLHLQGPGGSGVEILRLGPEGCFFLVQALFAPFQFERGLFDLDEHHSDLIILRGHGAELIGQLRLQSAHFLVPGFELELFEGQLLGKPGVLRGSAIHFLFELSEIGLGFGEQGQLPVDAFSQCFELAELLGQRLFLDFGLRFDFFDLRQAVGESRGFVLESAQLRLDRLALADELAFGDFEFEMCLL